MKKYIKWTFVGALVALSFFAATLTWFSRDLAATHKTLAQSDLPPLISVGEFYANLSAEWAYKPSVDGAFVAWRGTRLATEVVYFGRVNEAPLGWIADVQGYFWHDLSPHLHVLKEGRLWRVDPLNADEQNWEDVTPRGFRNWSWPSRVLSSTDRWFITSRDRNPAYNDLYTTRQDGSDKQLLIENDGQTLNWILSADLTPQMRFQRGTRDVDVDVQVAAGDQWRTLMTLPLSTTFRVFEVSPDLKHAIALSARDRDNIALVRVDLLTGAEEVLHEETDEDLRDVINLNPYDGVVDAVLTQRGASDVIAFSPRGQMLKSLLSRQEERIEVESLYWAGTGQFVTATVSPNAKSYEYLLFDLDRGVETKLGVFSFRERNLASLAETKEITITSRDGLELPSLLVTPVGVDGPVPTIIEVHGGPATHLDWQYHHFRQFLANRGYAVVAVNYRGSTGFGSAFQEAGYRAFGREMQDDLVDAAQWAIDQGIADPNAFAINGGSYGGYASAMAILQDNTLFKTAIIEHAMLDVAYQSQYPPHSWGLTLPLWTRYFGDPKVEGDLAQMRTYSPITHVDALNAPVLLVAGKRDSVVGYEQTEAFVEAARANNKEVELLLFEDEGHGIHKWQSNVIHARTVEDFLHEHLGGRSGGWDWIEVAAQRLD